jgi:hypothetical protein
MARGKKTEPEMVYKVMATYFNTHNYRETARLLEMPVATVKDIVDNNSDKDEFIKLRTQKENEFADKSTEIIDKGLLLLNRRLSRAIDEEESLDLLIDEIYSTDREELSQDEKNRLVTKIRSLQLQDIKAITTAIGTLFDKRALTRGEMTQNVNFATNFDIDKLMDIAGYTKKADDSE